MISKETLAQVILDYHRIQLPDLIERELDIKFHIPIRRARVILGPRRSGKTFYMYSLMKKLLKNNIQWENILYINFEDPKLTGMDLQDMMKLLDAFYEIYPAKKKEKIWLFLDEVQAVVQWEKFVRHLLDRENAEIFLSGSSSRLLSKEIATSLRGRTLSYMMLPFSFAEFLKARDIKYSNYMSSEERSSLLNALSEYFTYGGYPEAVIYPAARNKIMNEIVEITVYRDVIERHNIRNIKVVKLMFKALIEAKEFSIHQFYHYLKSLNIKVGKNNLYNYLEYFNEAFVLFPLRKFSSSIKNLEQSIPKIYSVDNGFLEIIVGNNKSKKMENLVFLSLLRMGYELNKDIFYYSLHAGEIDFVIRQKRKNTILIQACYDMHNFQTRHRELKSLIKASEELMCKEMVVITYDQEGEEKIGNQRIRILPLWKWLMGGEVQGGKGTEELRR